MFERFCINPVRIYAVTSANGSPAPGDDARTLGTGTPLMASVQQAGATLSASLAASQAIQAGQAVFSVFFTAEPIDVASARASQRLTAWDRIDWTTATGEVRRLGVLGPVRNEGGAGVAWSVDCAEIAN